MGGFNVEAHPLAANGLRMRRVRWVGAAVLCCSVGYVITAPGRSETRGGGEDRGWQKPLATQKEHASEILWAAA